MAAPSVSDLYLACRNGDLETVQRLLPNTSIEVLNRLESNGSTCLHAASFHGHIEIVRLLLRTGASRQISNRYGCTPLDEAKTQEIADLFPRNPNAAKKRYSNNPVKQTEWQFAERTAESFSRAFYWNCVKDRGVKNTVKKIRKAHVLDNIDSEEDGKLVQSYFSKALETNNPIYLLKAYTAETSFYDNLNQFMATGSESDVYKKICRKWSGYYTGLIMKNPTFDRYRYSGLTYRGMEITQEDYAQYKIGRALSNKSFQSTSKSWKVAKGFAYPANPKPGRLPVIIVFDVISRSSALNIEEISEYADEEEVLIVPGTFFMVTNINQDERPCEISVKQIEWTNDEL